MKLLKTFGAVILFQLLLFCSAFGQGTNVDWNTILQIERTTPTPYSEVPAIATFYSAQHSPASSEPWPALPCNSHGFSAWNLWGNVWLLDDLSFNYRSVSAQANQATAMGANAFSPAGAPATPNYGTNLYLSVTNVLSGPPYYMTVYPALQNTQVGMYYELCTTTNLNLRNSPWQPYIYLGEGNGGTLNYYYQSFTYLEDQGPLYLCAVGSSNIAYLYPYAGTFTVSHPSSPTDTTQNVTCQLELADFDNPTTYEFQMTGSAVYGVDYTIPGMNYNYTTGIATLTVSVGTPSPVTITISPMYRTNATYGIQQVTMNLLPVNCVANGAGSSTETVNIYPATIPVTVALTNLPEYEAGLAYDPYTNGLVLSVNDYVNNGEPNNYVLVNGDGSISNFSVVSGVPNELETAVVQTTTNGFTEGDVYFADTSPIFGASAIDKLSADGSQWIAGWAILTNSDQPTGVCIDQTGVWNGNLIAVGGKENSYGPGNGQVWRIAVTNGNAVPTLVANIPVPIFESLAGVVTIPNNVAKWGPWAGKIITSDPFRNLFYAVDTNGTVTSFDATVFSCGGGLSVDSFGLIPPAQNLFFVDTEYSELDEISSNSLAPYVGDLVADTSPLGQNAPGGAFSPQSGIYIIRWNPATSAFESHPTFNVGTNCTSIYQGSGYSTYEDLTFAPIGFTSSP